MAAVTFPRNRVSDKSWFEKLMDAWRHVIQVSERTLVDNVAATVPWLAPVAPAYMVWHNAVQLLGWDVWVAWVVAAAVEGLGISVIATAFALWKEKRSTFWVAMVTTGFYLATVISVNVLLDLGFSVTIAKALLSLLSVPAAVTIALRTQNAQALADGHAEKMQEAEERRLAVEQAEQARIEAEERAHRLRVEDEGRAYERQVADAERAHQHKLELKKLSRNFLKVSESVQKVSEREPELPSTFGKWADWRAVPADERKVIAGKTVKQIMADYGKTEKTAKNWLRDALKDGDR